MKDPYTDRVNLIQKEITQAQNSAAALAPPMIHILAMCCLTRDDPRPRCQEDPLIHTETAVHLAIREAQALMMEAVSRVTKDNKVFAADILIDLSKVIPEILDGQKRQVRA